MPSGFFSFIPNITASNVVAVLGALKTMSLIDKGAGGRASTAALDGDFVNAWEILNDNADDFFAKDSSRRNELFRVVGVTGFMTLMLAWVASMKASN